MTYNELKEKYSILSNERKKLSAKDKNRYIKLTGEMSDLKREIIMFETTMRQYERKVKQDAGK